MGQEIEVLSKQEVTKEEHLKAADKFMEARIDAVHRLEDLDNDLRSGAEFGACLAYVKDQKVFLEEQWGTWKIYCESRWGIKVTFADHLCNIGKVMVGNKHIIDALPGIKPSAVAEFAVLDEEGEVQQAADILLVDMETYAKEKVSADDASKAAKVVKRVGTRQLPETVAQALIDGERLRDRVKQLSELKSYIEDFAGGPSGGSLSTILTSVKAHLSNAQNAIKFAAPFCPCTWCCMTDGGCKACAGKGWISLHSFNNCKETAPELVESAKEAGLLK